ncbi:MAG: hypothetical protein KKF58_00160 [Gammaproteobacteria bacterium]|nr:hypothetical protein [Gammaproteobacteria bacterium]MBU1446698.1 hypothetical protein [Gammaproteobacteria bacterium]
MSELNKPDVGPNSQSGQDNGEIDLLELWHTLLKYKSMILWSGFGAAVLAAAISLTMSNIYRAEVLLAPVSAEDAKGGLSSALGGLGGLASIAGISLGGGGSTEENLAVLKSRDFLWKFVQTNKLMPILFEDAWDAEKNQWKETDPKKQPGQMDVYRLFNDDGLLKVEQDKKTELVTIAVEWKNAMLAADWANALVTQLNRHLAQQAIARSEDSLKFLNEELMRTPIEEMRKTLYDLIANEQRKAMLANTQKDFAFKVLDQAVEPDKKTKPKRSLIVILAFMMASFAAVMFAFIKEGMIKRREQELMHG